MHTTMDATRQKKNTISPVGKTALCVSFLRMKDAQSAQPIGKDTLAHRFYTQKTEHEYQPFLSETNSQHNLAARHTLIDNYLTRILLEKPNTNIISIGSGLETRAFRLNGGNWYEIDDPAVIEYKNAYLPESECTNSLKRLACNFSEGELASVLQKIPSDSNNVFVIEGVFYYLTEDELDKTLSLMQEHSPYHRLICDRITQDFAQKFSGSFNKKISSLGAHLKHESDVNLSDFGYQELSRESVSLFAAIAKKNWAKRLLVRFFIPSLRDGYTVHQFSILGHRTY